MAAEYDLYDLTTDIARLKNMRRTNADRAKKQRRDGDREMAEYYEGVADGLDWAIKLLALAYCD